MSNDLYCTWVAIYDDGSYLQEIGDDGLRSFYSINQDKIAKFMLISISRTSIAIDMKDGHVLLNGRDVTPTGVEACGNLKPIEYRTCRQVGGSTPICISRTIGWESKTQRLLATYHIEENRVIIRKEDINERISG